MICSHSPKQARNLRDGHNTSKASPVGPAILFSCGRSPWEAHSFKAARVGKAPALGQSRPLSPQTPPGVRKPRRSWDSTWHEGSPGLDHGTYAALAHYLINCHYEYLATPSCQLCVVFHVEGPVQNPEQQQFHQPNLRNCQAAVPANLALIRNSSCNFLEAHDSCARWTTRNFCSGELHKNPPAQVHGRRWGVTRHLFAKGLGSGTQCVGMHRQVLVSGFPALVSCRMKQTGKYD